MLRLSPHISSYCTTRSCIECGFNAKQLPLCAHASHRSEPLRSSRTISLRWRLQLTEQMPRKPGTAPEHCNSNSRLRTERCRQGRSRNEVKPRAVSVREGWRGEGFYIFVFTRSHYIHAALKTNLRTYYNLNESRDRNRHACAGTLGMRLMMHVNV
jgi:hypothetical protein